MSRCNYKSLPASNLSLKEVVRGIKMAQMRLKTSTVKPPGEMLPNELYSTVLRRIQEVD